LAQVEPKPQGGRPEAGIRAAARELGIDRNEARRAIKIAGMAEEVHKKALDLNLDDNQSALLHAASKSTPQEQIAALNKIKEQGAVNPKPAKLAPTPMNDFETRYRQGRS
jgi:hypothetical protein